MCGDIHPVLELELGVVTGDYYLHRACLLVHKVAYVEHLSCNRAVGFRFREDFHAAAFGHAADEAFLDLSRYPDTAEVRQCQQSLAVGLDE